MKVGCTESLWISICACISLSFLTSCSYKKGSTQPPPSTWQEIYGRDEGFPIQRFPVYRAKIPLSWLRQDPTPTESIADTKKALCEFFIKEGSEKIYITIHNFPLEQLTKSIPPIAQIQRWKGQLEERDPTLITIKPITHGGFVGLSLESQGMMKGKLIKILGWSMQLGSEYDQLLILKNETFAKQQRAAYTIKAVGPPSLINKYKKSITAFADSFELIEELPSPL